MNFLQRFLRKGTENVSDPFDVRRILLLNLFSAVGVLTLLAAVVQSFAAHEPGIMRIALLAGAVLMAGVPLLGRRNPNIGAVYLIFLSNSCVWFFANSQGLATGIYFFYFPLFFANAWLMDLRKPLHAVLLLTMTIAGVVFSLTIPESVFGLSLPREIQEVSFVFNATTAACIMAANTLVIVWLNYNRQRELETWVAERERATTQIAAALKEKEILLAEIHHRVKNNLAVVKGLLNMQLNTTTNEAAKATLRESVNRVSTMALIHQKLYAHENPDSIDLASYVNDLVREISASYHQQGTAMPAVNTDVRNIALTLNRAVPCGLILNELLSNAFKHAFRNGQEGVINIRITREPEGNGMVHLLVSDNGSGFPEGFSAENSTTLGMTIIQSLSEQLDGQFTMESAANGTQVKVNFPVSGAH